MTVRINLTESSAGTSVRVVGRLEEAAARELLELCRHWTGELVIDLDELLAADHAAIETLKGLRDAGARIVGAAPYIRILLNGGVAPDAPAAMTNFMKEDE